MESLLLAVDDLKRRVDLNAIFRTPSQQRRYFA